MSNKTKKPACVYVELDCLMDTRLATLTSMDKQKASRIVLDGYHVRRSDNWDDIDMEEYRKRYENRNIYTLSQSTVSGCVALINKIGLDLAKDLAESPIHNSLELYVNTYPYLLTDEELNDLEISLSRWITAPFEFHFLYLKPEEVNVKYVNDKFFVLIMYDFSSWLELHLKEFQTCFLHEVTLFSPRINLGKIPSNEDLSELLKLGMEGISDEFDLYERIGMVFINLMLIDPMYFSILGPNFESLYDEVPRETFGDIKD